MEDGLVVVYVAAVVLVLVGVWKTLVKAGQPGWAVLIPFYNVYVLLKVAGKPGWWLLLMFVPVVNLVITIIMYVGIANNFGQGGAFGIGLWLLPFVFFPILGFGDARYAGQADNRLAGE